MSERQWIITDHALLRYVERVAALDLEAIRAKLERTPGLRRAIDDGASRYSRDGVTYLIVGRVVATIIDAESPSSTHALAWAERPRPSSRKRRRRTRASRLRAEAAE